MAIKTPKPRRRPLPRWAVIAVVLVTGSVTALALSASGMQGPQMAWQQASGAVDQVWAAAPMTADDQRRQGFGARQEHAATAGVQVAGLRGLPQILNGAPRPHGDRGPCVNCHEVLLVPGVPMPNIASGAVMPHPYRGVCGNCHIVGTPGNAGRQVAGTITAPLPPPPAPRLAEVEWLGLELQVPNQPANPAIPGQPLGATAGAVVTKADGKAKRAGVLEGDIVTSINAVAMTDRNAFDTATQNGALRQGTVVALRNGERFAFEIPSVAPAAPAAPAPQSFASQPMQPAAAAAPTAGAVAPGATF